MPTGEDYSPSGTFPTFPLSLVKDGEVYNFDSIQKSTDPKKGLFAKLMDAVGYLMDMPGGAKYKLSSRSITRAQRTVPFEATTGAILLPATVNNLPSGGVAHQYIHVPHGATITAVTAYMNPPNDGVLPAGRPTARLKSIAITTGTVANESSLITDPNATVGAYEAHHGFGPTGLSVVVDNTTKVYFLEVVGETSTDATDIRYDGCTATYTVAEMDDG